MPKLSYENVILEKKNRDIRRKDKSNSMQEIIYMRRM
ncbi:hypothetical protein DE167_003818 [Clostridium beijerinckii]|nr:hypothetical protein [Clostridium beijerinckii]NYC73352.1 hypothetical protein [Clostridium beijerinckii]